MATATLTSKGQLTVPKKVREALHLRAGDRLEFVVGADGTLTVYPLTRRVAEVYGMFAYRAKGAPSTEAVDKELGQAFRDGRL